MSQAARVSPLEMAAKSSGLSACGLPSGMSSLPKGFPKGLRIMVVDSSPSDTEAMLLECGFCPLICSTSADSDAIQSHLNSATPPDIMLVDVHYLAQKTPQTSLLLAAAKTIPLVLMATNICPHEIVSGITKQGAVDFMEKPLHMHKLKNIWQHVVRKLLVCPDSCAAARSGAAAHSPGISYAAADSGSNASTQQAMELDLETTSLLDAADLALGSPLAGLFSNLLMGDEAAAALQCGSGGSSCSGSGAGRAKGRLSAELRRLHGSGTHHRAPRPASAPPVNGAAAGATGKSPAIGYSCGQLPELAVPGMVWGLPTNPLQISPKPSLAAMMPPGSMPPWMQPPGGGMMMPSPPPGMFGLMPGMLPAAAAMPTMLPPAAAAASAAAAGPGQLYRRAESAPLKALESEASLLSGGGLVHSLSFVAGEGCAADFSSTLTSKMDLSKLPQHPPIGLQLKKSPSLMDMINSSLELVARGAVAAAMF